MYAICSDLLINDQIIIDISFDIIDLWIVIRANPFVVNNEFVTREKRV